MVSAAIAPANSQKSLLAAEAAQLEVTWRVWSGSGVFAPPVAVGGSRQRGFSAQLEILALLRYCGNPALPWERRKAVCRRRVGCALLRVRSRSDEEHALMPWNENHFPRSMANLTPRVRAKAIEIANALLEQGYEEGKAIRIAIAQAKHWAERVVS